MNVRLLLALLLSTVGCARAARPDTASAAAEPPAEDHWETMLDVQLVSPERCATGPFEVQLPAREVEWGRRIVFQVYGPRGMEISNRLDGEHTQWGIAMPLGHGDHSRCRAPEVAGAGVASGAVTASTSEGGGEIRAGFEDRMMEILDAPSASLPQLAPFEGAVTGLQAQIVGANAWLPQGDPWYYADELFTTRTVTQDGGQSWRLRFWFPLPADLEGVVIRVRDERLVPDLPIDEYRAHFAARVRDADAMRAEHQAEVTAEYQRRDREHEVYCETHADEEGCARRHYGPIPPPPRVEERPGAPGPDVDWIPGYWSWVESLNDFVWIGGTYVVRAVAVAPREPSPPIVAEVAPVEAVPVAPIELEAAIPPQPALRVETIPPPPSIAGALWVRGAWSLRGRAWEWTPGRWAAPPTTGARPRAPEVIERAGVRIYFPGGWVDVR